MTVMEMNNRCVNCLHRNVCKYKNEKVSLGTTIADLTHDCRDYIEQTKVKPLTFEELKEMPEFVWLEDRDKEDVIVAIPCWCTQLNSCYSFTFKIKHRNDLHVATHDYNERWRAWNYKPSYAKRRETPWKKGVDNNG